MGDRLGHPRRVMEAKAQQRPERIRVIGGAGEDDAGDRGAFRSGVGVRDRGKVGQLAKRVGMERTHLYRKLRSLGVEFRHSTEE